MRSGFFNSTITGYDEQGQPIFDRAEDASFFAKYFSQFVGNGVFAPVSYTHLTLPTILRV